MLLSSSPSPQHHRGIQAASIAGVVGPVIAVQGDVDAGLVVVPDHHRDVDVGVVAIVDAAEEEVAVEVAGVHVELEVLVVEVQRPQGEDHGLQHALRPRLHHEVTAVLLQRDHPRRHHARYLVFILRLDPQRLGIAAEKAFHISHTTIFKQIVQELVVMSVECLTVITPDPVSPPATSVQFLHEPATKFMTELHLTGVLLFFVVYFSFPLISYTLLSSVLHF